MSSIDPGKKIGVRWSNKRMRKIEDLGWTELDEAAAIDKALDAAVELEKIRRKVDRAFDGRINLLELVSQLNRLRKE